MKRIARPVDLTAVYEPVEEGWVQARIAELPAVITVGHSTDEARELLLDALQEYLLSLSEPHAERSVPSAAREERLEVVLGA